LANDKVLTEKSGKRNLRYLLLAVFNGPLVFGIVYIVHTWSQGHDLWFALEVSIVAVVIGIVLFGCTLLLIRDR